MMIEWLGEKEKASRMENAVAQVIKEGKVRTYDLGGNSTTLDVAHEVVKKL
jgi:isocitrate/isopropylmalate dehydrogenase